MSIWNEITVLSVDNIYLVPSVRGHHTTIKDRQYWGLSFCYEGKISYHWNDDSYISDATRAILLPKGETYFLRREESGSFPVINFTCPDGLSLPPFLSVSLQNPASYLKLCERMQAIWLAEKSTAKLMSLFYELLSRLSKEESENPHLLAPAMEYLGKHFDDPLLSNSILAQQANVSEIYFRKRFKEIYGISPHQYVLELRLRHAKLLLSENAATVSSIAEACGFSSVYHFCRAFKQVTGMTPKEFAQSQSVQKHLLS